MCVSVSRDMTVNKKLNSIFSLIGNTPMLNLSESLPRSSNTVYAKLEMYNPTLSIKDRIAKYMVEQAESRGSIQPGATLVEASSGNTGASLALVARQKGYGCLITTTEKASSEKVQLMRQLGATVYVAPCDLAEGDERHYITYAKKFVAENSPAYFLNQYGSQDNVLAHYYSTGPEIWSQLEGKIDCFVACASSGGTISGVGRYLKEKSPKIKVVLVDPVGSVYHHYFHTGKVDKSTISPYKIEGAGKNKILPTIDFSIIDDVQQVTDEQAFEACTELSSKSGIVAGGSSGACFSVTKRLVAQYENLNIVTIFPDSGLKYLSKI